MPLRIFRLQEGLLVGVFVYGTTIFLPIAAEPPATSSSGLWLYQLLLLYYTFIFILPFVAFAIELICTSEYDAVFRAGIYIRNNIEREYRTSRYRGWEDWLERQDRVARRRTSDRLTILTRRLVIVLYCIASAIIGGIGVSAYFNVNPLWSIAPALFTYFTAFAILLKMLSRAQQEEFSSPFYDVLVIDVDGCLTGKDGSVSTPNKEAIDLIRQRGVLVILATGRAAHSIWPICQELNVDGEHVLCHGAVIGNWPNKSQEMIDLLESDRLGKAVERLEAKRVPWVAFGQSKYYCSVDNYSVVRQKIIDRGDLAESMISMLDEIPDLNSWKWTEDKKITKILCYVDVTKQALQQDLCSSLEQHFQVTRSTDSTLEILSKTTSKVKATEKVLQNYNRVGAKALVLGDHDNDIELLRWGQHAVAPSNASTAVRMLEGVDVLPVSNDEDFVREAIFAYYELEEFS